MIVTTATPAPDELHPLGPLYDPPLPVGLLHQPREEGVGVSSPDAATLPVRATAAVRQRELEHVSRVRLVMMITCHVSRVTIPSPCPGAAPSAPAWPAGRQQRIR